MRWFVTLIFIVSLLLPFLIAKSLIFQWDEGIKELQSAYPDHSYLDIGGKSQRGTSGNFKQRDYLVMPGFKIVRVSKIESRPLTVAVRSENGLPIIGGSILAIFGLLVFVAIPYVRKNGISSP